MRRGLRLQGADGRHRRARCGRRRQHTESAACCGGGGVCCTAGATMYLPPPANASPFDGSGFNIVGAIEESTDDTSRPLGPFAFVFKTLRFSLNFSMADEPGFGAGPFGLQRIPLLSEDDGCTRGYTYDARFEAVPQQFQDTNPPRPTKTVGSFSCRFLGDSQDFTDGEASASLVLTRIQHSVTQWQSTDPDAQPSDFPLTVGRLVLEMQTPIGGSQAISDEDYQAAGGLLIPVAGGASAERASAAITITIDYSTQCDTTTVEQASITGTSVAVVGSLDGGNDKTSDMFAQARPVRTDGPAQLHGADSMAHSITINGVDIERVVDGAGQPLGPKRIVSAGITANVNVLYRGQVSETEEQTRTRFLTCPAWLAKFPCADVTGSECCDQGGPCGKLASGVPLRWSIATQSILALGDLDPDDPSDTFLAWLATSAGDGKVVDATPPTGCVVADASSDYGGIAFSAFNTDRLGVARQARVIGATLAAESFPSLATWEQIATSDLGTAWRVTISTAVDFRPSGSGGNSYVVGGLRIVAIVGPAQVAGATEVAPGVHLEEAIFRWNDIPTVSGSGTGMAFDETVNTDPIDDLIPTLSGTLVRAGGIGSPCISSARLYGTQGFMVDSERVGWITPGQLPQNRRRIRVRLNISNIVTLLNIGVCPAPQAAQAIPLCEQCGGRVPGPVCRICGKRRSQPCAGCGA